MGKLKSLKIINKAISIGNSKEKTAEIYIMGDIASYKWEDEDVTPTSIKEALAEIEDVDELELHITSSGGSVMAGTAIINLIDQFKKNNNCHVTSYISYAASMATCVAMVADTVKMYNNAGFMIHKPISKGQGNATHFRKLADILDVHERMLVANYTRNGRFKGTEEELMTMLENETYINAKEAFEWGFVDEIINDMALVASSKEVVINGVSFNDERTIDIFNTINKSGKGENKMLYDNSLNEKYGISEETFNAFNKISDLMIVIEAKIQAEKDEFENSIKNSIFVEKKEILDSTQREDITKEEMFEILNKGLNATDADPELEAKAKEFDKIKEQKIKDVLDMGVTAYGAEIFDNTSWSAALKGMDYAGILNMEKSFVSQAKSSMKAGFQASQFNNSGKVTKEVTSFIKR